MPLVMDANGNITDSPTDPFAGSAPDFWISMQQTAPIAAATGGAVTDITASDMGAPVPGLQADAPYTPADQTLVPGAGETPLTADVPYNVSDQAAPNGFNSSASGAIKDGAGIGEWAVNGFKSLVNGFLGSMNPQTSKAVNSSGGSYGPAGSIFGRFGTATASTPGSTQSNLLGMTANGLTWLVILGLAFTLILSWRTR